MLRPAIALLATTAVAIPAVASAKTITSKNVVSPTKQLKCHALKTGGPGIECRGSFLPDFQKKVDLEPYAKLKTTGTAAYGETAENNGYGGASRTLNYGDTWKWKGVTCKLTRSSMTCRNQSKHGFTLTRGKLKRF